MTILNLMTIAESSSKWEETSNFFFSHSVFKRLIQKTRKNQGLCGKGLNLDMGHEHLQKVSS